MLKAKCRSQTTQPDKLPGHDLNIETMPGHWVLAQMGKRVLRPGGIEMTRVLLTALQIIHQDQVVELAPGLGLTARVVLDKKPASYIAIESDPAAVARVQKTLSGPHQRCVHGTAHQTGLDSNSRTVVYGEAMLTMQTLQEKRRIIQEAARILQVGGRYGLHELCLVPEELDHTAVEGVQEELSQVIRVGARPLKQSEWCSLLESAGFKIESVRLGAFHLLEPRRIVRDEGVLGAMRIAYNMLRNTKGRRRVLAMRRVIRRLGPNLMAIMILARKA